MEPGHLPWKGVRGALALALGAALSGARGAPADAGPAADAARSGAALGLDLYRIFARQDGNVLLSPYCVSQELALLCAGAGGKTRQEVLGTLHWTRGPDQLAGAFLAQDLQLDQASRDGALLSVATSLWVQRGGEPRAAFLQEARVAYRADVRISDFAADLPVSRHMINYWVERKTGGKITAILPDGSLTPRTRMVLANAIYFKGRWDVPFDEGKTAHKAFLNARGQTVMAPTMARSARFRTTAADPCELLELPYAGGRLSMVILLPRARDGLAALERRLDAADLWKWFSSLDHAEPEELDVALPRFKSAYSAELTSALVELGMPTAFAPGSADFSPINGGRELFVSTALHKALVEVNEEGTEAAAATAVALEKLAVIVARKFPVDHPFIFAIRDSSTGCLLFLGRIVDPRSD